MKWLSFLSVAAVFAASLNVLDAKTTSECRLKAYAAPFGMPCQNGVATARPLATMTFAKTNKGFNGLCKNVATNVLGSDIKVIYAAYQSAKVKGKPVWTMNVYVPGDKKGNKCGHSFVNATFKIPTNPLACIDVNELKAQGKVQVGTDLGQYQAFAQSFALVDAFQMDCS